MGRFRAQVSRFRAEIGRRGAEMGGCTMMGGCIVFYKHFGVPATAANPAPTAAEPPMALVVAVRFGAKSRFSYEIGTLLMGVWFVGLST